jgi:hypothetical protein
MSQELNLGSISIAYTTQLAQNDRINAHYVRQWLPTNAWRPRELPIVVHSIHSHSPFHV